MTKLEELAIKLKRVRTLMEEKKLDAIWLKRQDDFAWLSCGGQNYIGWGELGNCGLLVTQSDVFAITNNIEYPRMRDEEHLEDLGFKLVYDTYLNNKFEGDTIRNLVPNGKIGTDYANGYGQDISGDIKVLRLSLTESEQDRLRKVGQMASLALEEACATMRVGETEIECVKRIADRLYDCGMEFTSLMAAADDRLYNYRHAIPTGNTIKERLQVGGNMRKWGLTVCMTRYVNFVPVTAELRKQYRLNQEIDLTLMTNTVPGRKYLDPFEKARALYEKNGIGKEFTLHHVGGPIGYANRDYRVDYSVGGTIQDNQAFCWNPSITGTKSEDTILVHKDGFEFITRPYIFPTVDIEFEGKTYKRADILEKC